MVPTCPSAPGTTANISGATCFGALAQAATRAATATSASDRNGKALLLGDFDHELRAAHAHDGGRRADLHGLGRLLHHLPGDRREAPLVEVAQELALVGGAVEAVLVDGEDAVGTDRHEAVVGEGHAGRAVR